MGCQEAHDCGTLADHVITDFTALKAGERRGERASHPSSANTHILHVKSPAISSPRQVGVGWERAELHCRILTTTLAQSSLLHHSILPSMPLFTRMPSLLHCQGFIHFFFFLATQRRLPFPASFAASYSHMTGF